MRIQALACALGLLVSALVAAVGEPGLLVSAAASLGDVLLALEPEAERAAGMPVRFNFGGSGALRRQIEAGAEVDIFFSAGIADMDALERAGLLEPGSRRTLLSNSITLIGGEGQAAPRDRGELVALLRSASTLTIANPDAAPAGLYALRALKSLGLHGLVEGRLALAGNARQALQLVETGAAPLGLVFSSDAVSARAGGRVTRLYEFPMESLGTPIPYNLAILASSREKAAASRLAAFLQGASARAAFERAGFGKTP